MKAIVCVVLLLAGVVLGAEEKKNEKRGVLGLGYGLGAPAPLYGGGLYGGGLGLGGHGLGLYSHGLGGFGGLGGYYGHGLSAPLVGHGLYGHGLSAPLIGHSAPLLSHSVAYSAPLHTPLLGLGHGWH